MYAGNSSSAAEGREGSLGLAQKWSWAKAFRERAGSRGVPAEMGSPEEKRWRSQQKETESWPSSRAGALLMARRGWQAALGHQIRAASFLQVSRLPSWPNETPQRSTLLPAPLHLPVAEPTAQLSPRRTPPRQSTPGVRGTISHRPSLGSAPLSPGPPGPPRCVPGPPQQRPGEVPCGWAQRVGKPPGPGPPPPRAAPPLRAAHTLSHTHIRPLPAWGRTRRAERRRFLPPSLPPARRRLAGTGGGGEGSGESRGGRRPPLGPPAGTGSRRPERGGGEGGAELPSRGRPWAGARARRGEGRAGSGRGAAAEGRLGVGGGGGGGSSHCCRVKSSRPLSPLGSPRAGRGARPAPRRRKEKRRGARPALPAGWVAAWGRPGRRASARGIRGRPRPALPRLRVPSRRGGSGCPGLPSAEAEWWRWAASGRVFPCPGLPAALARLCAPRAVGAGRGRAAVGPGGWRPS